MKVEFLTTLDVRFHDGVRWQLTAPFVATVDGQIVRVPDGFLTDFASVPRLPMVYMQFANKAHRPAVLHDWLYRKASGCSKIVADAILQEALERLECPWWLRYLIFQATYYFGHSAYNWALKYVSATLVTVSLLAEPVGATLLAIAVLGQVPSIVSLLGGVCILTGVVLATRSEIV